MKLLLNMMVFDFGLIDEFALVLALVGYVVVFVALVALIIVFKNLPKVLNFDFKRYFRKRVVEEIPKKETVSVTGEVNAAVSAALFLFFSELHDEESGVITIKKISRRYSPWSSKIYGLRHIPRN